MFSQGDPDLVRGGGSGGPWPGPSRRSPSRGRIPRASPWADRRERANGIRGLARRGGPRRGGRIPEPRPRPTDAGEPTDLPGWLARQGEVRSPPTKVPRAPQAEGKLAPGSRTCPVGDNAFWGTTLAGAKTFRPTLRLTIPHWQDLVPGLGIFFKQDPPARRANSHPGTARDTGSFPGRQRAGRSRPSQGAVRLAGRSRPPLTEDPWTPGGSGCVPLPWGPTSRPPSGRSGAK